VLPGLPVRKTLQEIFDDDLREFVLQNLSYKPEFRSELSKKGGSELLVIFMNWQSRLVARQPRRVHKSANFLSSRYLSDADYATASDHICRLLEGGQDVTPHLSTRIVEGYQSVRPGKRKKLTARPDLDMLLGDWGLHHMHLSVRRGSRGFVERTGPVLIAAIQSDDAYLVDIIAHGAWTSDHLVHILVHEWPNAGLVHRIQGVLVEPKPISSADRKTLRDAGMNAHVNIDGVAYRSGLGYASAGNSTRATMDAHRVTRALRWFCNEMDADPHYATKLMVANGAVPMTGLDLHFEFFLGGGYGIVDRSTGFRFSLTP